MANRLFSLIIVPDSGNGVKTGSFNFKFILALCSSLICVFFICLFFIIGYHIKLRQEKDYKRAVSTNKSFIEQIKKSEQLFHTLSEKIAQIKRNDIALRLIENMDVIDDEMYNAGIGGHVIVDNDDYSIFNDDLKIRLNTIAYGVTTLEHRINVQENSLWEIQKKCQLNLEMINNTPSILPTRFIRITSRYGSRWHPIDGDRQFHDAIDLGGSRGQPIISTADGVVTYANRRGRLGNCVIIKHKYGYETLYGHLDKMFVSVGQEVKKRDTIGTMGRSGMATGVHLHYSVVLNDRSQNPAKYFK